MSVSEAASLVVELTVRLSDSRRERDAWRCVALTAIEHARQLHDEIDRLRRREGA